LSLDKIIEKMKKIVCTEGVDKGVVFLSDHGPTKYDSELKANVYVHEYFSPLGDALIEVYEMIVRLKAVEEGEESADAIGEAIESGESIEALQRMIERRRESKRQPPG